jgi:hypothetical protein
MAHAKFGDCRWGTGERTRGVFSKEEPIRCTEGEQVTFILLRAK